MTKSKLTLGELEPVAAACSAALKQAGTFGLRLKLRAVLRALDVHAQDFDKERAALVEKYTEKDADGQPLVVEGKVQFSEHAAEVDRLWHELIATAVTVEHDLKLSDVAGLPGDATLDALELLVG